MEPLAKSLRATRASALLTKESGPLLAAIKAFHRVIGPCCVILFARQKVLLEVGETIAHSAAQSVIGEALSVESHEETCRQNESPISSWSLQINSLQARTMNSWSPQRYKSLNSLSPTLPQSDDLPLPSPTFLPYARK
jgi:hypothetical protein